VSFQRKKNFFFKFIFFIFYRKSQYRSDYEGIDINQHHREPAAAPKDLKKPYVVPQQKMETMTVTQVSDQIFD